MTKMKATNNDFKKLTRKIKAFRDERDWMQFHNHKAMALSLLIEAAELAEHFQWKSLDELNDYARKHRAKLSDELADVAIYLLELADNLRIDLFQAIEKKLVKNAQKYPVDKAKGKHTKYTGL
jgi:dCTP diphosphatase